MSFVSGDLDEDTILDRCHLLLDFDDILRLDEVRRRAQQHGADLVVREALVGDARRRMFVFGYVAGDNTVWRGTLAAIGRGAAW